MRRPMWFTLLLLLLLVSSASASGFGRYRRPVEVRPSYYVPSVVYYYPAAPRVIYSPPPVFVAPPVHFVPHAFPVAAPPSVLGEPPLADPPRRSAGPSTSLRP